MTLADVRTALEDAGAEVLGDDVAAIAAHPAPYALERRTLGGRLIGGMPGPNYHEILVRDAQGALANAFVVPGF